jgi:hypothetical protein
MRKPPNFERSTSKGHTIGNSAESVDENVNQSGVDLAQGAIRVEQKNKDNIMVAASPPSVLPERQKQVRQVRPA